MSSGINDLLPFFQNTLKFEYDPNSLNDDVINAASGIADIYEFHNIALQSFTNGSLKIDKKESISNSKLDLESLKIIAMQAYEKGYLAGYVDWLMAIIHKMEEENSNSSETNEYK